MEKRHAAALLLAVLLSFPGCSAVLERSYDVVEPHNSQYWEDGTSSACGQRIIRVWSTGC